jgi:hypothetical protein
VKIGCIIFVLMKRPFYFIHLVLFVACFCSPVASRAGNEADTINNWVPQSGVYMDVSDLQDGIPTYTEAQLYKSNTDANFSITKWSRTSRLLIYNNAGKRLSIKDSVFCVVDDGKVRVFRSGKFHDVLLFGQICYFKEYLPMRNQNLSPVVTNVYGTVDYLLLDLKTGAVFKYSLGNIEHLIKDDEDLYYEFKSIKKSKQRKKMMYLYIEKYNSRNPLPYSS